MMSFRTWCLAILPGAFLHTIVEALGMHLVTTWTTAWGTQSQAKLHTETTVKWESQKPASLHYVALLKPKISPFVMSAQSFWSPNLSQKDCLLGSRAGSGPAEVDQHGR